MRGLIRAWLVLAVVAVAALTVRDFNEQSRTWRQMDNVTIDLCTRQQINLPNHPDSLECIHRLGADKTIYQHEGISAEDYWSRALAIWVGVVIAATMIMLIALFVVRWIIRGFTDKSSTGVEEWWGRTFEARGSITPENIPADLDAVAMLRRLATKDVAELFRSEGAHDHPSVRGLLAKLELRRRESWTARAALAVSILALLVAALRA